MNEKFLIDKIDELIKISKDQSDVIKSLQESIKEKEEIIIKLEEICRNSFCVGEKKK